jgi:hypothetical protein
MPFSPPSGVTFHTADEIPVSALSTGLRKVAVFLQSLRLSPEQLRLYHDWWQHDGLHFEKHRISFHDLFAMIASPRALFEATPTDVAVFVGIAPEEGHWYLRFRAEWAVDDHSIVGCFAVILPPDSAAVFRTEVSGAFGVSLAEKSSDDYYKNVMV